jgi:hypothetical protein
MEVIVKKNFVAFGRSLMPGDVIDIKDIGKLKKLIASHYVDPIEPEKIEKKTPRSTKISPKVDTW